MEKTSAMGSKLAVIAAFAFLFIHCGSISKDLLGSDSDNAGQDAKDPNDPDAQFPNDPQDENGEDPVSTDPAPRQSPPDLEGPPTTPPELCVFELEIWVDAEWDSIALFVDYPPSDVAIPGHGSDKSVWDTIVWRHDRGARTVNDHDSNYDGLDDRLNLTQDTDGMRKAGLYATLMLECLKDPADIEVTDFDCTVTAAKDEAGASIPMSCTLR